MAQNFDADSKKPPKKLIIRLSSMGDVILTSSVLQVRENGRHQTFDWVVSREYAPLLRGHPSIGKVWEFDRKSGFQGWKKICAELFSNRYSAVFDLHSTWRSRYLRFYLLSKSVLAGLPVARWTSISKRRGRLYGYFVFKALWPKIFRPEPLVERAARCVGGKGSERPDLTHLLGPTTDALISPSLKEIEKQIQKKLAELKITRYVCIMPSSKWSSKNWPIERYAELLIDSKWNALPVILGTQDDFASTQLHELLLQSGRPVVSAIGHWSLPEVARLLSKAWRYLGNDTGLSHLAEAIGTPSIVFFGPTIEDMGFGPWRTQSRAVGIDLLCRPCGKDGSLCYRFGDRYACLRKLAPRDVFSQVSELGSGESS